MGIAHGDINEKEGAKYLLKETDMMLAEISLLNELQLWEVFCTRMANTVVEMRHLVKGRIIEARRGGKRGTVDKHKFEVNEFFMGTLINCQ